MTKWQDAINFDVLSGVLLTMARKEVLSLCFEPLPSAYLQPPTVIGRILLHERRGCLGASTPVLADNDSSVVHSGSILSSCQPILMKSFFSLGHSSPTWKQNTAALAVIVETIVAGGNRAAAVVLVARFCARDG